MNRFFPLVSLISVVATITLKSEAVSALERSEIAAKAKEFTVQIDGEEAGTGTIIEHNGNSYTVLTCWHVVDTPGKYQVITTDGKQYQATEIKNLPDADLATIEFTSSTTYQTAKLGNSQAIAPGTSTYVVGYPDPIPGIPERTYTFLDAAVVSQLVKEDKGYTIIHDNPSTPGGSGGGMFNINGSLIGVNGKSISDANTNRVFGAGIPLQLYLAIRSDLAVLTAVPTNVTPPQDFVSVGQRKLKAKDYQSAIAEFNQALDSNPNNIHALAGKAEAYYWLEDFQSAIQYFDSVLERNPKDAISYSRRGDSYRELGDYEKALSDHTQAVRLNLNSAIVFTNRGATYDDLGESEKAIADYTEAIRLDPKNPQPYLFRGHLYSWFLGEPEYKKAIADYDEAIRLDPKSPEPYMSRGLLHESLNVYEKARGDFQKSADLYLERGNKKMYQLVISAFRRIEDWK